MAQTHRLTVSYHKHSRHHTRTNTHTHIPLDSPCPRVPWRQSAPYMLQRDVHDTVRVPLSFSRHGFADVELAQCCVSLEDGGVYAVDVCCARAGTHPLSVFVADEVRCSTASPTCSRAWPKHRRALRCLPHGVAIVLCAVCIAGRASGHVRPDCRAQRCRRKGVLSHDPKRAARQGAVRRCLLPEV